jgi:hypothetical protein
MGIASPVDMGVWIRWYTSMIRLQLVFSYALLYTIRKSGVPRGGRPLAGRGEPCLGAGNPHFLPSFGWGRGKYVPTIVSS